MKGGETDVKKGELKSVVTMPGEKGEAAHDHLDTKWAYTRKGGGICPQQQSELSWEKELGYKARETTVKRLL